MAILTSTCEQDDLGGGRFRSEIYVKPRFAYKNGVWRRATDQLAASAGLLVCDELADVRIKPQLTPGDNPLLYFSKGESHVNVIPLDTKKSVGVLAGNSITFPGAWPGCNYTIRNGGHFIGKEVELSAGYPDKLAWDLSGPGLDFDTLETPDFRIAEPYLYNPKDPDGFVPVKWLKSVQGQTLTLTAMLPRGYEGWIFEPTLTLQPDAAAGLDTFINGSNAVRVYNYGILDQFYIGAGTDGAAKHGLIQFDLSSLPSGATITLATLTLVCTSEFSTTDYAINIHKALTQWFEGVKAAAPPDPGQDGSTYNLRNANGAVPWAGGGGGGSGSDYTATATASTLITDPGTFTWNGTADVQAWFAGTSTNYGWWLINAAPTVVNSRKEVATSDHATAAYRPKLVVTYDLPGAGLRIFAPAFATPFNAPFV